MKKVLIGQARTYIIQMLEFLPLAVKTALSGLNLRFVYELRIRSGKPIFVNYKGEYRYLTAYGVSHSSCNALTVDKREIEEIVYRAGKCSVYAVEEQIKRGFITADHGERIGLAGEYVYQGGRPLTIKNVTSLCIRVPHEIIGCADGVYEKCFEKGLLNVLLMSPPGLGKTTILRDLARKISVQTSKNVLICDERGEIDGLDMGETCDTLKFADKETAFEAGIRSMRPDVMITDELLYKDLTAVEKVIKGGVFVIATAHFSSVLKLPNEFRIFDRYAVLDGQNIGKLNAVYDSALEKLF